MFGFPTVVYRDIGVARGIMPPQNVWNIWSFCALRGRIQNKTVLFA